MERTFDSAIRALVNAGRDREWARKAVVKATLYGMYQGPGYKIEHTGQRRYKVTIRSGGTTRLRARKIVRRNP